MIEIVWLLKLASQSKEIAKNHNKIIVINTSLNIEHDLILIYRNHSKIPKNLNDGTN
jgi:hypothetical protein